MPVPGRMTEGILQPPMLSILSAQDVDTVLQHIQPQELVKLMAKVFWNLSSSSNEGNISLSSPHRTTIESPSHVSLFMPSRIAVAGGTAVKIVSLPKGDSGGGLPATTLVLDEVTGEVSAVINARQLTAVRNAAG